MERRPPATRAQPPFHRRAGRIVAGLLVVVLLVGGVVVAGVPLGWFGDDEVDVAPVPTAEVGLSPAERAYYDSIAPRLHELGAQARELARLGEERSRNIFDLQAHAGRLTELSAEIDAFVAANGVPGAFAASHASYLEGVRLADRAMDEAERAILSADWERLGRVVAVFDAGAEDLEHAAELLDAAGGGATPAAVDGAAPPSARR